MILDNTCLIKQDIIKRKLMIFHILNEDRNNIKDDSEKVDHCEDTNDHLS